MAAFKTGSKFEVEDAVSVRRVKKTLRSASPFRFAVADSIGALNPQWWDEVTAAAGLFMSRPYLLALERALPANMRPCYALVLRDGRVCAAVLMQIVELGLAQVRKQPVKLPRLLANASQTLATRLRQKVLVCGNLLNYGFHGVAFAEGVDRIEVWHGIADLLYRLRRSYKLEGAANFVLIKDLPPGQAAEARRLELLSYRTVETEPNMVLTLDPAWRSYEDYAASLASKYRSGVRKQVMEPIEQAGCTLERFNDFAHASARMHELYLQVQANADVRPFELPPRYFATLADALGDRLLCSVVRREQRLLGFLITVADGHTAIAYHIGFDREAARELPIYLRLLHASIADAITLGCSEISFGRTALEPKAALGAKPVPFAVMVRHSQPLINAMIKGLLLGIEHEEAPQRNPFKKASSAGAG